MTDFIAWLSAVIIVISWRLIDDKVVVWDYVTMFSLVFIYWFTISYILKRYRKNNKDIDILVNFISLLEVSIVVFGTIYFAIVFDVIDFKLYSKYVATTTVFLMIVLNCINVFLYYGYRYAASIDVSYPKIKKRETVNVLKKSQQISDLELKNIQETIVEHCGQSSFEMLSKFVDISSSNTKIIADISLENVKMMRNYRYDAIVNIVKMNEIRGINRFFVKINEKLPDDGILCCCFTSIAQFNQKIRTKYPPIIRQIVETFFFIQKRILPKIFITNRLWFDITGGKKRVFSNVEILGRLYYCGFEVIDEFTADNISWVIARRTGLSQKQKNKRYGLIIKLPRVGKDGKTTFFYKMRTMFPYSEYIQKYIYEKSGTDEIGKAKDDIRITAWGKIFRKFWLDELPMIWNLLKGDLKIVGVRPLSKAFFNTYPPYLQKKRIKTKPGLIPPLYYDLPKTMEEIFISEECYIDKYLKSPIKTDLIYFFKAFYNIIFKKARSH
ncbi:MAG: sugar transferase [Prevotellaceae bacterium]|nr:sugar transferase [Prevotellaceae bacterium]